MISVSTKILYQEVREISLRSGKSREKSRKVREKSGKSQRKVREKSGKTKVRKSGHLVQLANESLIESKKRPIKCMLRECSHWDSS